MGFCTDELSFNWA